MPVTLQPSDAELHALRQTVEAAYPAFLADLERLVNIDCGSYSPAGVDEVGTWVAAFLERLGARVERRADPAGRHGHTVIGTFERASGDAAGAPAAGPRLVLIGHLDTVFDDGTAAARPFRIDGNRATGPGVTDMKAGLLAGLHALEALLALPGSDGGLPFERLTFIANPDEEVGSPSSTPHIRAAAAEADAVLVLECGRANGDVVSARKGMADTRIVVHGRAAHAGIEPEKGRHAILEAARIVRDLQALNGRWPGVTFNVGTIHGGTRPNVVPERCELAVDARSLSGDGLDTAIAAIQEVAARTEVAGTTVDAQIEVSWRPMEKTERSARLVEHVQAVAERLGFHVDDAATGGASDANTTSGMGVPSVDGLGPVGGLDHSPGEYLEIDSIVPRTTMLAGLLVAIARDPEILAWRASPRTAPPAARTAR